MNNFEYGTFGHNVKKKQQQKSQESQHDLLIFLTQFLLQSLPFSVMSGQKKNPVA